MFNTAHIHPMIVHFPLVLLPVAIAMQFTALVRNQDLASTQCLPLAGFRFLIFGTITALVAAAFGDISMAKALSRGFTIAPLQEHEQLGMISIILFVFLTVTHGFIRWSNFSLSGGRGWFMVSIGIFATASLLITAYFGGQLVYELGVNVATSKLNI
tara:strand:- start:13214 stop:13684 length:471 start_codon:yes stop_codon:yes gene_type:complete